uniref:BTB domain-containing protein n=1 Tax=Panagrolaimus davidi TaxID=227884 RepID=A0A914P7B6_9BILA
MAQFNDKRYQMFKDQNTEKAYFDVTFDVEGKLIHAHKYMLSSVSDVLQRMISDTWKNGKTIKTEKNSYNDFYEFLTFLYSGNCKLNDENIFSMVDMSEFYQVKELQIKCDDFLSKKEYTKENFLVFFETLSNYSLPLFEKTLFKAENGINLIESDRFMETSKEIIMKIVNFKDRFVSEEKLFEKIYEWAENQAKKKQSESNEETLNLNNSIKSELIEILPFMRFKKMKLDFLINYVVKKGFLFSFEKLSEILNSAQANINFYVKVKITNEHGKSISCMLPNNSDFVDNINSLKNRRCTGYCRQIAYWTEPQIKIPSTKSQIKKRNGIEWYLYCNNGAIGVMQYSTITTEYLIAEMIAETSSFEITYYCKVEIE